MNWLSIFKIYNLKKLKKEKVMLLFTMLSILITTTLSIVVPTISANMDKYNKSNVREANGGDLFIKAYYQSKAFDEELHKLKNEGYKVTIKRSTSAFLQGGSGSKFYANLISGEEGVKEDEIILGSTTAKNLSVKVGDKINVKTDDGVKEYRIKAIEGTPKGLSNDEVIIGYGKIGGTVTEGNLIYIEGRIDGEVLKERLKKTEDGYIYSSIKDKEAELKSETDVQVATFGILTTMGYILSSAAVITTSIMLIVSRRRDISIMKLISLRNKDIKKALRAELSIIILVPVLLSASASLVVSGLMLKMNYLPHSLEFTKEFSIIGKGILINALFFGIFSNLPLLIVDDFKGLWLLRENAEKNGVIRKRIFIYLMLLMPLILVVYSVYIGSEFNLVTAVFIVVILLIFFILSVILIKIFSSINYRSQLPMYSFKNMKKNFLTFILLTVSLSITLVFTMIAVSLNNTVKKSMNKSLTATMPYNYLLSNKDALDMESILTKENGVEGYIKVYCSNAKVLNDNIKAKAISIDEVKREDYKLEFKMVEGEGLFHGEDGCLITSKYQQEYNLKVGDILHIYFQDKIIDVKIKGVYDNSIIDSMAILMPYKGYGKDSMFYVKAEGRQWMDKIGESPVISIDILGGAFSEYIGKFLKIFKALSLLVIFASLIFNINLLNITFTEERKEETVIRALGLGKAFITKVYVFKGTILILLSAALAYGFYLSVSNILLKLIGVAAVNTYSDILLLLLCSLVLTTVTFSYPFLKMKKYNSYEYLRES